MAISLPKLMIGWVRKGLRTLRPVPATEKQIYGFRLGDDPRTIERRIISVTDNDDVIVPIRCLPIMRVALPKMEDGEDLKPTVPMSPETDDEAGKEG